MRYSRWHRLASALAVTGALVLAAFSCSAPPAAAPSGTGGSSGSSGGGNTCSGGLTRCGAACVDLQADPGHCGSCGSACQSGQQCQSGACTCIAPLTNCNGSCVNLTSSPQSCGACGNACPAGLFCSLGACSTSCANGLTACGAACVDLASDSANCATCGAACGPGQICSAGACSCTTPGQQLCGGQCTDVSSNAAHCGACGAACAPGQVCSGGVCSGGGSGGASGSGGGGGTGGAPTGSGVLVGTTCFPLCASAATDDDQDGYGFEAGRSCVVAGSTPSIGAASCEPPAPTDAGIPPGDGFHIGGVCHPRCASDATDPDEMGVRDGWGYEQGRSCIVAGSTPAMQAVPCIPDGPTTGDGYQVGELCVPPCAHPELADAQGYGYEAQQTCVVDGSMAATQNARCTLTPRTDLPPPGSGFQHGETCYPPCGGNAQDVTADGFGWDMNRTCIVSGSTASIQGVPCVPPPSDVTGECPRELTCPVVNSVTLTCGCTWVDGLAERKAEIMATSGASQYFLASAMMETANLRADYTLGDGKTNDAFNAGLAKQNWGMIRRCHPAWSGQSEAQYPTATAMNADLALDIQVYNECRSMFGAQWWSGHRNGYNNLGSNTQDIQEFKGAMDWTNQMLTGHLEDDVRFWVTIRPI